MNGWISWHFLLYSPFLHIIRSLGHVQRLLCLLHYHQNPRLNGFTLNTKIKWEYYFLTNITKLQLFRISRKEVELDVTWLTWSLSHPLFDQPVSGVVRRHTNKCPTHIFCTIVR
ncbi:hypothetical protein B0H66DRAFT_319375 [Apodospora peruviana]|uniref:Uncharacterized protein n=1 Tax=Apodospora peruviana TaxID=516989 RepID=A0AAE0HXE7_9PEZI|nr:hypothetical protein B0H66DRAFT_319375 [Apodospora peruviana]